MAMFGLTQFLKRCARLFSPPKGHSRASHFTDIFTSTEFESQRLEYLDALLEQAFLFVSSRSEKGVDRAALERVLNQPHLFSELMSDIVPTAQSMLSLDRASAILVSYEFLCSLINGAEGISNVFIEFSKLRAAFNPNLARNSIVAGMGALMNYMDMLPVGGVLVLAVPFFYNVVQQRRFHAEKSRQVEALQEQVSKIKRLDENLTDAISCVASASECAGTPRQCNTLRLLLHWPAVKDQPWLRYAIELLLNQRQNALDMDRVFSSLEKNQPNFLSCFDLNFTREVGKHFVLKSGRLMSIRNAHSESYEDFDESQLEPLQKLIESGVFSSSLSWFRQYVFMWALMNRLEEMMANFQQRSDQPKIEAVRALLASMRACPFFSFDLQPPFNRNETSIDRERVFIYRRLEGLTLRVKDLEARCNGAMAPDSDAGDYVDPLFGYVYRGGKRVENPAEIAAIVCQQPNSLDESDSKLELERFALSAEVISELKGDVFQTLLGRFPASALLSQALLLRLGRDIHGERFISPELIGRYRPMVLALGQNAEHAVFQYCLSPEKLEKERAVSLIKLGVLFAFGGRFCLGLDGRVWRLDSDNRYIASNVGDLSLTDLLDLLRLLNSKPHYRKLRQYCLLLLSEEHGKKLDARAYELMLDLSRDDAGLIESVRSQLYTFLSRSNDPAEVERMRPHLKDHSEISALDQHVCGLYQYFKQHEKALRCALKYNIDLDRLGYEQSGLFIFHRESHTLWRTSRQSFRRVDSIEDLALDVNSLDQALGDRLINDWAAHLETLPGNTPEALYETLIFKLSGNIDEPSPLLKHLIKAARHGLLDYCSRQYFSAQEPALYKDAFARLFDESAVTLRLGVRLSNDFLILPSGAVYRNKDGDVSRVDFSRPSVLFGFLSLYADAIRYRSQPPRVLELMAQAVATEEVICLKAQHWFALFRMKSECVNKVLAKAVRGFYEACFKEPDFSVIDLSLLPPAFKLEGVLDELLIARLNENDFSLLPKLGDALSLCSDVFFRQLSLRFVSDISAEEVDVLRDVLMRWLFRGEKIESMMSKLEKLDITPKETLAANVVNKFQEMGDHVSALRMIVRYDFAFAGFGYRISAHFAYYEPSQLLFSMPDCSPVTFTSEFFDNLPVEKWHALFSLGSESLNKCLYDPVRYWDALLREKPKVFISLELLPAGLKDAGQAYAYLGRLCLSGRCDDFEFMHNHFECFLAGGFASRFFSQDRELTETMLSVLCKTRCLKKLLDGKDYFLSPGGVVLRFDGKVLSRADLKQVDTPLVLLALLQHQELQLPAVKAINQRLAELFRTYLCNYFYTNNKHKSLECLRWLANFGPSKVYVKGGLLRRFLAKTEDPSCDVDAVLHFFQYSSEIFPALEKAGFKEISFVPGLWRNRVLNIDLMVSFGKSFSPQSSFTVNEVIMPLGDFLKFTRFDSPDDPPPRFEGINDVVLADLSRKTLSRVNSSVELDVSGKLIFFFLALRYHLKEGFACSDVLLRMLSTWLHSIVELTPDERNTLHVKFGELVYAAGGVEKLRPQLEGLGFFEFFKRHGYYKEPEVASVPGVLDDGPPGGFNNS